MILETFIVVNVVTLATKYIYTKVTDKHSTYHKIVNDGLYHITTKENAKAIIESGYIKPSNILLSGGKKKCFFFAGIPSYMDICRNTASFANQYEFNAVKLNITHDELARFKQRTFNDEAIIYEGKCYLPNERVEIIELVLDLNKGNNIIIRPKTEKEKKQYIPSPQLIQHLKLKQKKIETIKRLLEANIHEIKSLPKNLQKLTIHSYNTVINKFKQKKYKLYQNNFYIKEKVEKTL